MSVPTDAEARKILSRFIASHFRKTDKEHARFRIPADPAHDDDLRMSQYIDGVAALRAENERLRNAATLAHAVLTRLADSADYWSDHDVPVGLVAEVDSAKARLAGVLNG